MSRGASSPFTGLALSGFCMQISILLESAIPLYEGLKVMAEDSPVQREKEILTELSDKVRMGLPFHQAVREAGCFRHTSSTCPCWGNGPACWIPQWNGWPFTMKKNIILLKTSEKPLPTRR